MKTQLLGLLALILTGATASALSPGLSSQLMDSAQVDLAADVATLPLHLGYMKDGRKVWFVLTDTNDRAEAKRLGLTTANQLSAVSGAKSTRMAHLDVNGNFIFDSGTVNFSPRRQLTPGDAPNFFPPKTFTPGSIGDANYSPFVRMQGTNTIYNAPIVAFDVDAKQISFCGGGVNYDLVHDKVSSICPEKMQVSLKLGHGFGSGSPVVYLSTDSNNALPATMEGATFAAALDDLKGAHADEVLYAFANGPTGVNNPNRQGFNSALAGEGAPLNILEGVGPSSTGYTPLWDVNVAVWTGKAIAGGQRMRLVDGAGVDKADQAGLLTNPMGGRVGSLGLLVNCPVIGFLK